MKLWQLYSVLRPNSDAILRSIEIKDSWRMYAQWLGDIKALTELQDREKLDSLPPEGMIRALLDQCKGELYFDTTGYLRAYQFSKTEEKISFLEAYIRFGGTAIEDVLEYGSVEVRP